MKSFTLALVLLCLLPLNSFAAWTLDGVPLTNAAGFRYKELIISDGAGGAIIAWADIRYNDQDIYVQRIGTDGAPMWAANGVIACNASGDQTLTDMVSDGAGGVIMTWSDTRSGLAIYAQRVNAAGVAQWAANGVPVCIAGYGPYIPRMVSDGSGGAVLVWTDYRNLVDGDIYAQRINSSGVAQWTVNGVDFCNQPGDQDQGQIAAVSGGFIIVWRDARFGVGDPDLYAQKVNTSGAKQWGISGNPVCGVVAIQDSPQLVSDGAGGAVFVWGDYRNGNYDLYAQHLNSSGAPQWFTVVVSAAAGDQQHATMVSDGSGGAVVAWPDGRSGSNDIYAVRLSSFGVAMWANYGVPVCTAAFDQGSPTITSDDAGGYIFCWNDNRSLASTGTDIYAQRLSGAGAPLWGSDGVGVCLATGTQANPFAINDGSGGTIVAWPDTRGSAPEIYAGRVDNVHGFQAHPEPVITSVSDVAHDQGGKVAINWTASTGDIISPQTIGSYSVWRAVASVPFGAETVSIADAKKNPAKLSTGAYLSGPGYYFEKVGTQSAHGWPGYSFVADTRADSISGATNNEVFMVAAHDVYNDFIAFASNVVSGHSVDNLAPEAPLYLIAQRVGNDVQLKWNRVRVPDLRDYSIYRQTSSGVTPVPVNFLENSNDTLALDAGAPTSSLYYIVTAKDVHANQSAPSNEASVQALTGVGGTPPLAALQVLPNHPNPFSSSTNFEVGLPAASNLSIAVYDVAGRRVRQLEMSAKAGWQRIAFPSLDDSGRPLASGVYFYRVHAVGTTITRKMVIAR